MDDGARIFAYTTWILMASLAVIVFSNPLMSFLYTPGWAAGIILLLLAVVYGSLSRTVSKRYIRKCPPGSGDPWWIAALVWAPPVGWVTLTETSGTLSVSVALITGTAIYIGFTKGLRAGRRQRNEWLATSAREAESP
ncbi:MAG: hypothetical protein ACQER4_00055 [Bacteroidota bacterium]